MVQTSYPFLWSGLLRSSGEARATVAIVAAEQAIITDRASINLWRMGTLQLRFGGIPVASAAEGTS